MRALRDNNQYDDTGGAAESAGVSPASWPLHGLVWDSGKVLAHLMATYQVRDLRILEVGCGIALSSLVLNQRKADITATDYHPEAGNNLQWNGRLNDGADIPFYRTGWADTCLDLGAFDLIIAGDVLYEPDHPTLLAGFIESHANPSAEVIIVDPGRGHLPKLVKLLQQSGFVRNHIPESDDITSALAFHGQVRRLTRIKP